jgi:hypothetical protein
MKCTWRKFRPVQTGPDPVVAKFLQSEVLPYVEVTIVRAPEDAGPVVDVALVPAKKIDGAQ